MYYYIFLNKRVVVVNTAVNTAVFPQYVEMNPQQVEFYLLHTNASIEEIKECKLNEPEVISLDEYKLTKIEMISIHSLNISNVIIPDYKIQNALSCVSTNHTSSIYSHDECLSILEKYNNVGKTCRDLYYETKTRIENSQSIEEVDSIVYDVLQEYEDIKQNNL